MKGDVDDLYRQWKTSRDVVDERRYLAALVALGKLSTDRVAMAASLGHLGAACVDKRFEVSDHFRTKIKNAAALLDPAEQIRFALECAEYVFPFWREVVPIDDRVSHAIDACRAYLKGANLSIEEFHRIAQRVSDAARELDDPDKEIYKNPSLVAAVNAANAVFQAAATVEATLMVKEGVPLFLPDEVEQTCSYAARFAVIAVTEHAGNDPLAEKAEEQRQLGRLIESLLNRVE